MDLLKEFAPEFAQHQMDEKTLLLENDKYQAVVNDTVSNTLNLISDQKL